MAGQFAYTTEGLLSERLLAIAESEKDGQHLEYCRNKAQCDFPTKEEDGAECRGHIHRTFVRECWVKCGCGPKCTNRLTQRGVTRKLEVN